ncbi:MAG: hypothetical protein ACRD3W_26715, partial [Terriglobales bacterium]
MPLRLTRKELYDLVWAKPRSEIAKQLGVSDVRLGKLCNEMNVPAPCRGYWANLAGTRRRRRYEKPSLTYNLAERIEDDHAAVWALLPNFDPKSFGEPIPPPPVMPNLEATLTRYKLLLGKTPIPKSTRGLHPITQKFLAEDERLAKLAKQYSWEKPKFRTPEGERLLQGLNQLLWMWSDLGLKPRSHGHRHIALWIRCGDYGRSFQVTRTDEEAAYGASVRKNRPPRFELWFDTQTWERGSKKPALIFQAFTRAVFRTIAFSVIEHWETEFRESVKRNYDWKVAERKGAIEQAEQARKRERQRKAAELKALLDSRQKLLENAITSVARSDKIRSLVRALDERIGP